MTIWQGLLLSLGVLLGLIMLCIAVIFLERKFPSEKYDERQKIARGNAYRVGFGVSAVYYLVILTVMVRQVDSPKTVEPYLLIFGGLLLQAMVMHIYCILTHAALPLSEKPWIAVASYLFCGALYLATSDWSAPLTFVGYGSHRWTGLWMCVFFFALAVMHIVSLLRREKE